MPTEVFPEVVFTSENFAADFARIGRLEDVLALRHGHEVEIEKLLVDELTSTTSTDAKKYYKHQLVP